MKTDGRVGVASGDPAPEPGSTAEAGTPFVPVPKSDAPMSSRRPERPTDGALRFQLFTETRGDLLVDLDPALRENRLSHLLADEIAQRRSLYPDASAETIECAGQAVGRIVVSTRPDALVLVDLAVLLAWRGRGIGRRVLVDRFGAARARGRPVRTTVPSDNIAAVRFFTKVGFEALVETAAGTAMEWRSGAS